MGCYDSFYNKDNYEIQVKLYDDETGGLLRTFNIGDKVPRDLVDAEFESIYDYGENYNIFPYNIEDYVVLIRNGIFVDSVHYLELKDDFIFGVKCYDKYGQKLNLKTVKDYVKLREEAILT